ncbi:MAG: MBL fold metallo-hydrolase [Thermosphaera sp.]
MKITWHGHACISVETPNKYTLVFDPHDGGSIGLKKPNVKANLVLVTHNHFDHNAVEVVSEKDTRVFKEFIGQAVIDDLIIYGFESFHDKVAGKRRGINTVYMVELRNKRIVHMGDIGDKPPAELLSKLHGADILMIPVGGFYTIEPSEAWEIIEAVEPRNVLPIHYWIKGLNLPIRPVEDFLKYVKKYDVKKLETNSFNLEDFDNSVILPKLQ